MYGKFPTPTVAHLGAGGAASLAATGLELGWLLVAAGVVIFTGLALLKLTPRRQR